MIQRWFTNSNAKRLSLPSPWKGYLTFGTKAIASKTRKTILKSGGAFLKSGGALKFMYSEKEALRVKQTTQLEAWTKARNISKDFEKVSSKKGRSDDVPQSPREISQLVKDCLLYTSPSPRDLSTSRMPSSA